MNMTPEEKIEKLKELLNLVYDRNIHAENYDYEGGSMWEAYDTGMCQGKTQVAKDALEIINK